MVLYSVITTYHLLEAMVHKLRYNNEQEAVLMVSQWIVNKYPWYQKMKCIFDKVIVFEGHYRYESDTVAMLNAYFSSLFNREGIELEHMDEIHVFGAEHAFGAYLFANEITNHFWEEGAGALSKRDSMLELFGKAHGAEKAGFQCELHLHDGDVPFVVERFYDKHYQLAEVEGDNLVHFDLAEELELLPEESRNVIIGLFYGTDKIVVDGKAALLLTECFANIEIMTWEEQMYLYKYLVDYFLSEYKLLIKPHPDDLMHYESFFENCRTIRTKFPAELLPFIFDGKPSAVATSSSTSIYGLRSRYDKVMEFNFKFSHEKQFYNLNRYYVALRYADKLVKEGWKLNLLGVNPVFVDNFYRFQSLCTEKYTDYGSDIDNVENVITNKTVWIIDVINNPHGNAKKMCKFLRELPEDNMVLFVNSDESYCFYDYDAKELWKTMEAVEIRTVALPGTDNAVTLSGPQINEDSCSKIYMYQRGEKFSMYELKRELPNVGVSVEAHGFDGDKCQIKLLEGMLEATEKRLLYYIGREKELLEKMEEK